MNANRGLPTPPLAFEGSGPVTGRLEGDRVEVDEALRRRLADVCTEVQVGDGPRAEAGRDWWPLAMLWALAGQVTALPSLVARPAGTEEVAAVLAACHEARVPVTPAAGRSGVCGASVPRRSE